MRYECAREGQKMCWFVFCCSSASERTRFLYESFQLSCERKCAILFIYGQMISNGVWLTHKHISLASVSFSFFRILVAVFSEWNEFMQRTANNYTESILVCNRNGKMNQWKKAPNAKIKPTNIICGI